MNLEQGEIDRSDRKMRRYIWILGAVGAKKTDHNKSTCKVPPSHGSQETQAIQLTTSSNLCQITDLDQLSHLSNLGQSNTQTRPSIQGSHGKEKKLNIRRA